MVTKSLPLRAQRQRSEPSPFGARVRARRELLFAKDRARFSLRQVALRLGVSHALLSMIEHGKEVPSEKVIRGLARELGEREDELLVLAGRVPADVERAIQRRPDMLEAVRALAEMPEEEFSQIVRKLREGDW
jgi:HTH-type transcriptional regulator, competence development regulator